VLPEISPSSQLSLASSQLSLDSSQLSLDWTGLDWTRLDWTGLDWTGLDWTGLDWTGLDWTGLNWTLDWTGLDWTGLAASDATPLLLEGPTPDRTGLLPLLGEVGLRPCTAWDLSCCLACFGHGAAAERVNQLLECCASELGFAQSHSSTCARVEGERHRSERDVR